MRQTALVTGASSGIGFEFAKILAEDNYDLVLIARNKEKLREIKKVFEERYKIKVIVIVKDLSEKDSAKEVYDFIRKRRMRIDVLVNNAGFGDYGLFIENDWEKEFRMLELNVTALTYFTKLFARDMVKRKNGRILNVSSIAAFQPGPLMAVYYASKSYVLSFSEALARELKGTGVSVTVLCPGPTKSDFAQVSGMKSSRLVKGRKLPSSEEVARFGYDAMKKGKVVVVHGFFNRLGVFAVRFIPRNMMVNIVYHVQKRR